MMYESSAEQFESLLSRIQDMFGSFFHGSSLFSFEYTLETNRGLAQSIPLLAAYNLMDFLLRLQEDHDLSSPVAEQFMEKLNSFIVELESVIYQMEVAGMYMNENRYFKPGGV